MASLFGSSTKKTTSQNQMYPALQQGWDFALGEAKDIYGDSKAPRQASLVPQIRQAFDQTMAIAGQGVPNLDQLYGVQSGILGNGGYTSQMTDASNYLKQFADGSYTEDPRLQRQLDINADRAANATSTRYGGGRYGSAAIGNAMGSAVADANNGIMLQSNENARNRQLSAAGQMGSLATAGANNMATWGAMSPMLNELRYDGASRMAGIGDYLQNRAQQRIDNKDNFRKQNLGFYTGILGGMGNNGSTQVTNTPGPSAAQSILGGALGGATIGSKIPGVGAGWGGLLGAGIGAFA